MSNLLAIGLRCQTYTNGGLPKYQFPTKAIAHLGPPQQRVTQLRDCSALNYDDN